MKHTEQGCSLRLVNNMMLLNKEEQKSGQREKEGIRRTEALAALVDHQRQHI